jgi:hypothetical protein
MNPRSEPDQKEEAVQEPGGQFFLSGHFTSTIQVAIGGAISKDMGIIYSRRCASQYLSSGQCRRKPMVCRTYSCHPDFAFESQLPTSRCRLLSESVKSTPEVFHSLKVPSVFVGKNHSGLFWCSISEGLAGQDLKRLFPTSS